jgi:hypothetical protein
MTSHITKEIEMNAIEQAQRDAAELAVIGGLAAKGLIQATELPPMVKSRAIAADHPYKRMTELKTNAIVADGYQVTGYVLRRKDDEVCISEGSAVRWMSAVDHFSIMHPSSVNPQALTSAAWRPVSELPSSDQTVLLFDGSLPDCAIWPGSHDLAIGWTYCDASLATPTHWMPMPAGPVAQMATINPSRPDWSAA